MPADGPSIQNVNEEESKLPSKPPKSEPSHKGSATLGSHKKASKDDPSTNMFECNICLDSALEPVVT